MANNFLIENAADFAGKKITVNGWLFNKRSSGGIVFLQIRDGTGFIQATVLKGKVKKTVFEKAKDLTLESSLSVSGKLREDKRAPGGYELTAENLEVNQLADPDYPIGKKAHGPDFLLSNRHLWIRSKRQWAILKIRVKVCESIEEFYKKKGFIRIDTPVITPSACEGTTTLFEIDYFGDKAYLSQSGQLYLEAAIASFGKVYDFSPVFRAEKSKTRRHLIEFWMTNSEIAFYDLDMVMKIQEQMIMFVLKEILDDCGELFSIIGRNIASLKKIRAPFLKITYDQAVKKLHQLGSDIKKGEDFGNDDETLLMNDYKQPLFVTHYPTAVKAFYMKRDVHDSNRVLCCDLFAPEGYGEITGGSEREDDYHKLLGYMNEHKLPIDEYRWYLDLRKYGSVPHSGFGLGIERFLAWICGLEHVRETIPFPRLLSRYRP